jgi:hypothetical protein
MCVWVRVHPVPPPPLPHTHTHMLTQVSLHPICTHATHDAHHRYLFYLGRMEAIQLEYTSAYANLELAIRKAPRGATGFLQSANKLAVRDTLSILIFVQYVTLVHACGLVEGVIACACVWSS